jgi:hypothetical protein
MMTTMNTELRPNFGQHSGLVKDCVAQLLPLGLRSQLVARSATLLEDQALVRY